MDYLCPPTRRVFIYEAVVRQQCLVALDIGECIGYLVRTHDFLNHAFVAQRQSYHPLRFIWAQHAQLLSGRRMMRCRQR